MSEEQIPTPDQGEPIQAPEGFRASRRIDRARVTENSIIEQIQKQTDRGIAQVYADMQVRDPVMGTGVISENHFYHIFLPWFAGTSNPYEATTAHWASMAGSYFSEVDVVNEKGEVVLTVPPLMERSAVAIFESEGHDRFEAEMEQVKTKANIHPKLGLNALTNMIAGKLDAMIVGNVDALGYIKRWNDIFKHYGGHPLIVVEGAREQIGVPKDYVKGTPWGASAVKTEDDDGAPIVPGVSNETTQIQEDEYDDSDLD